MFHVNVLQCVAVTVVSTVHVIPEVKPSPQSSHTEIENGPFEVTSRLQSMLKQILDIKYTNIDMQVMPL